MFVVVWCLEFELHLLYTVCTVSTVSGRYNNNNKIFL